MAPARIYISKTRENTILTDAGMRSYVSRASRKERREPEEGSKFDDLILMYIATHARTHSHSSRILDSNCI